MKKVFVISLILVFLISTAMSYFFLGKKSLSQSAELDLAASDVLDESEVTPTLTQVQKELEISAWAPWWEEEQVLESLQAAQGKLKIISPVWYHLDQQGQLLEIESSLKLEIMELAKESQVQILPTVSNAYDGGFDPQRVSLLLSDDNLKESLITQLIETAQTKGFDGWDLDWEEISEDDKELYSNFLADLSEIFHEQGLKLSVAVHAQTGSESDWIGVRGHDLEDISQVVDYVRVMAYDFHYADSVPGSVTPIDKLIEVIEYNLALIPTDKLVLGLPTYGYNWGADEGVPLQYYQIDQLISDYELTPKLDDDSYSLTVSYIQNGINQEIWYENSFTLNKKIKIAMQYGIYQVCLWHIGGEDPEIWESEHLIELSTDSN